MYGKDKKRDEVPPTYERLLLFNVLIVVVEAPVDLVILLPLRHILDLLRSVVDGPENLDSSANQSFKSRFIKYRSGSKLLAEFRSRSSLASFSVFGD